MCQVLYIKIKCYLLIIRTYLCKMLSIKNSFVVTYLGAGYKVFARHISHW